MIGHRVCAMMRALLQEDPQKEATKEGKIDVLIWTAPRGVAQVVERCLAEQEVETVALPPTESLPPGPLHAVALADSLPIAAAPTGAVETKSLAVATTERGGIVAVATTGQEGSQVAETTEKAEERTRAPSAASLDAAACTAPNAAEQISRRQPSWMCPQCPSPPPPAHVQEQASSAWQISLPPYWNWTLAVVTTGQAEVVHKSSRALLYPPQVVDQFSAAQQTWWVYPPLTTAESHFQPFLATQDSSFFSAPQTFWVFQAPAQAFDGACAQRNVGYYCGDPVQAFPNWGCYGACE